MNMYSNIQPNIRPGLEGMSQMVPGLDNLMNPGANQLVNTSVRNGVQVVDQGQGFAGQIGNAGSTNPAGGGWFSREALFGGVDAKSGFQTNGWASTALGAAGSLMSGYMAMKQYGLAKDQLAESKRQFNKNFEANRKSVNTRLEDRQAARVASNPNAYQSVGEYMNKNKV